MYRDRSDAGRALAKKVLAMRIESPLVLAIPRGGVVVAREIASALGSELDIVLTRKIGAPFDPEYAVAAVDPDGELTRWRGDYPGIDESYIQEQAAIKRREILERLASLREGRPEKDPFGRTVLLVDDGLATGLTALAAIKYLRKKQPSKIILAVPVAPEDTLQNLASYLDGIICPLTPRVFYAVGQWYDSFEQVRDEEVKKILKDFA